MIIPAIDLQNGEAVRLFQGDYNQKTVYGKDPVEIAIGFERMGARYLHVVDLDGAKEGSTKNLETIRAIRSAISIPIQVGGGIRTAETVALYLNDIGINRVILGTSAVQKPEFAWKMIKNHGADRIVIGVDAKDGKVRTQGWLDDSGMDYLDFIEKLRDLGARIIVLTDISRDGSLTSPNWEMYSNVKGMNVIVSGGVSSDADLHRGREYFGIIVGKAYYEGKVDLKKMLRKRIIPCLDIKDSKVVKGVNFVGLSEIGDPVEIAKAYQAQGADEIVLLDITATVENRPTTYELISRIAGQIQIPITVGGGVRSVDDIRKLIDCGADKVSGSSAFVKNPDLLRQARAEFGKESIVAAIDGKKIGDGFHVITKGGREDTGLSVVYWARRCERLGAGEILLTSMDRDGVRNGYDIEMTKLVANSVNIPVIASGGCGEIQHIVDVFNETACDAALVASLLHYGKATIGEIRGRI